MTGSTDLAPNRSIEMRQTFPASPERLVFTWAIESETGSGEASTITLRFLDRGASTELVLKHEYTGLRALGEEFRTGWQGMFSRLRAHIGSPGGI